jgi:Glycosyltransferases involved in cell wall biogenesis
MIIKNEEHNLIKCLGNIKSKVDEIVIVDTGSTDKTKEIAKRYTDRIFDFEWCNDFAAARNYSISMAKNDWILILDADEVVEFYNKKTINKFIAENDKVVGRIKRINTFEDGSDTKKLFERVNRLFNRKYFKYEGIIHEQVVAKDGEEYNTLDIEITVKHIGYEKEVLNMTNKIERNKELLQKAILTKRDDPYLYYQLGKTFFMEKNYTEAEKNFHTAVSLEVNTKYEYVEDLIESYGYTLINLKKYKEALALKKYEDIYTNKSDFNFVMGLVYMNNAMFQESVSKFLQCQNNKECRIEGVNSYLANYNIGVIYECLGMLNEAVKYYKKCGNYILALNRLKVIK